MKFSTTFTVLTLGSSALAIPFGKRDIDVVSTINGVKGEVLSIPSKITGTLSSVTKRTLPVVGDLPVVGNVASDVTNTVDSVPVVGGLTSSLTKKTLPVVGNLPVVNNVVPTVENTVDSVPVVGDLTSSLTKKSLPVVDNLPALGNVIPDVTNTVDSVPVVGGVVSGLTKKDTTMITTIVSSVSSMKGSVQSDLTQISSYPFLQPFCIP